MSDLARALRNHDSSLRMQAAMAAGVRGDGADAATIVNRCADEQDPFVRDTLTWALTRMPRAEVVPLLLAELDGGGQQARVQALHTLSKIGDQSTYPAVVRFVDDTDLAVARTAWRASVALVSEADANDLAVRLSGRLGHGDRATRLGLSRALIGLGADVVAPVLAHAPAGEHLDETLRLLRDPDAASELAVDAARREVALGRTRSAKG